MINVEAYMAKSKSIITVVGKDQVGIIARVTGYLYENNVNDFIAFLSCIV